VSLRDRGVSADYLAELKHAGYRRLSVDEILQFHDHGVSADYVQDVVALGYGDQPAQDIVKMRDHGVSAGALRRAGSLRRRLSVDELIRLRDSGTI
jgi:hypothetical protein